MKMIGRIEPGSGVATDHLVVRVDPRAVLRKGMSLAFGVTDDGKMMRAGWARLRDCIGFDQKSFMLERPANVACPAVADGDFIFDPETPLPRVRGDLAGDADNVEDAFHDLVTLLGLQNIIRRALKRPGRRRVRKALRDIQEIVSTQRQGSGTGGTNPSGSEGDND